MAITQHLKGIRDLINRKRLVEYVDLARYTGVVAGEEIIQETPFTHFAVIVVGLKTGKPFDPLTDVPYRDQITDIAVFRPSRS